jgi:fumarate reductase flavoprotein subunit
VLDTLAGDLGSYALPAAGRDRAFNLTWHDWLNLGSLVRVSRAIVRAALSREDSRGAHYRDDFPQPGELATSTYTRVRERAGQLVCEAIPVRFTRARPGESLVRD